MTFHVSNEASQPTQVRAGMNHLPTPRVDRWEQGSDFHWMGYENSVAPSPLIKNDVKYFGSGRDALQAIFEYGRTSRGWKRLWIPSYFCQEVVASLLSMRIDVAVYKDGPTEPTPVLEHLKATQGDVLLVVNYFGLRDLSQHDVYENVGMEVIEDHTHDPWSQAGQTSYADWCVASLRKVLPVPDGGLIWSPAGHDLPPESPLAIVHKQASLEKLAAMTLKSLYLEGHPVEKKAFRSLAASGESQIAAGENSGISEWTRHLLPTFPVDEWRKSRWHNFLTFSEALEGVQWLNVLLPSNGPRSCPFSGILVFDSCDRRAYVNEKLIASNVYPAILWPLEKPIVEGIPEEQINFSRRMLSIHCDARYTTDDMKLVAALIRKLGNAYSK